MGQPNYAMQDAFLGKFFSSKFANSFYLTGGTALARFYFQHRESVDLDLFTNAATIDMDDVNRTILRIVHDVGWTIQSQRSADAFLEYFFIGADNLILKVDVVRDIPIHIGNLKTNGIVKIDSLENIGSNKVTAIYGRTEAKDFIDLYWIIHHSTYTFDDLYILAQKKDIGIADLHYAYALKNINLIKIFPVMLQPLDWKSMQHFFIDCSEKMMKNIKPID